MSEAELIDDIKRAFGGLVAPGAYDFVDDAAMIPPVLGDRARVITTDLVVEHVDFDRALYPIAYAGYRALAQNLSDVAAMGAVPVGFVWSLAIPRSWSRADVAELARGAAILAKLRRVPIFGGDLSSTTEGAPLVCSITAFGDVEGLPVRRSGARAGDDVFVLGADDRPALGASAAGLRLLRSRGAHAFDAWLRALGEDEARCVRAHITPRPADGSLLARVASACVDVSDGFARDLGRMASASNVAIHVDEDAFAAATAAGALREEALHGGEDYALLFTASPGARVPGAAKIGVVVDGAGVRLGGAALAPQGYDHFA